MLGLNMFALIVFTALNGVAAYISRCTEDKRNQILRLVCVALLVFNTARYALSPLLGRGFRVPVEFSTFAYFAVPIIVLFNMKRIRSWAAFSGFTAGFFYYAAMIAAGGILYGHSRPYDVYLSMACHGVLYLYGMADMKTHLYAPADRYQFFAGIAYVALRAHLLRPWAGAQNRFLIYGLLDGTYVKAVLPATMWGSVAPLYYMLMTVLLFIWISIFFKLNRTKYQRYLQNRGVYSAALSSLPKPV